MLGSLCILNSFSSFYPYIFCVIVTQILTSKIKERRSIVIHLCLSYCLFKFYTLTNEPVLRIYDNDTICMHVFESVSMHYTSHTIYVCAVQKPNCIPYLLYSELNMLWHCYFAVNGLLFESQQATIVNHLHQYIYVCNSVTN